MKSNEKMFDLKSIGMEPTNVDSPFDLLNDKDLDEMQKAESYKISFRLFDAAIWIFTALSLAMLAAAEWPGNPEDNHILSVFGLVCEGIALLLYTIYAAVTSSKGLMNAKFAKRVGKKSYLICYLILGIFYVAIIDLSSVYFRVFIGLAYFAVCAVSLFAMRNNKVLDKMNEEE